MNAGDLAFFYHSGVSAPHIAGVVRIVEKAFPDPTQFDPKSKYFDANSTQGTTPCL
jgi:predicted RNA-binding protein with PUA-like domain